MTRARTTHHDGRIRLRPAVPDDLGWMATMAADRDLVGDHNWTGEPRDREEIERELGEQFADDGLLGPGSGTLVVELEGETPIGEVQWRTERWGPSARSTCPAIGIALLPEFRGLGHGTTAQRLLVDHLFETDESLHRVQSDTAADNPAEQRALEKTGMVVEGRVRNGEYRDGAFHDHLLYSVLREEWEAGRADQRGG